jgi:hypothetical protein
VNITWEDEKKYKLLFNIYIFFFKKKANSATLLPFTVQPSEYNLFCKRMELSKLTSSMIRTTEGNNVFRVGWQVPWRKGHVRDGLGIKEVVEGGQREKTDD